MLHLDSNVADDVPFPELDSTVIVIPASENNSVFTNVTNTGQINAPVIFTVTETSSTTNSVPMTTVACFGSTYIAHS